MAINEFELAKICCEELLRDNNVDNRKAAISSKSVEALLKFCSVSLMFVLSVGRCVIGGRRRI